MNRTIFSLKQQVPALVAKLVPANLIIWDEFNLQQQNAPVIHAAYPEKVELRFEPGFNKLVYQNHPCVEYVARTRCTKALKITDFMSARQYRQTGLYAEGMRLFGLEYNMGFQVIEPSLPVITNVSLVRTGKDFSEADRLKLNILRSHIGRAYIHAGKVNALRADTAAVGDALAATRQAVIALAGDGNIIFCTDTARNHLDYYFKDESGRGRSLPAKLSAWMRSQDLPAKAGGNLPRPRQPLVIQRDGSQLTVHLVATPARRLLLLEEHRVTLSAEPLQRHLGLTPRRAEVLLWMAQGKTSGEIAIILGLSVSTVHKHTERIFETLGVETRTAAAMHAMEIMNQPAIGPV